MLPKWCPAHVVLASAPLQMTLEPREKKEMCEMCEETETRAPLETFGPVIRSGKTQVE